MIDNLRTLQRCKNEPFILEMGFYQVSGGALTLGRVIKTMN
jgi:hypothetical protein